ncbi:MAG TPA: hypothetical protein VG318_18935 [Actinomycetota bacterium]|nr:hypothetical protein [Actinomycetota bacterium]
MTKVKRILGATLLALAGLSITAPPASACGGNDVCDTINEVCRTALHVYCLR